jgi:hypothetical protein
LLHTPRTVFIYAAHGQMKKRWVCKQPSPKFPQIGNAIVASWWPGRFHLISTAMFSGKSPLARLTKSLETGRPFAEIDEGHSDFVTQIFRCDENGLVRERDIETPIFEKSHTSLDEAKIGHEMILQMFLDNTLPGI